MHREVAYLRRTFACAISAPASGCRRRLALRARTHMPDLPQTAREGALARARSSNRLSFSPDPKIEIEHNNAESEFEAALSRLEATSAQQVAARTHWSRMPSADEMLVMQFFEKGGRQPIVKSAVNASPTPPLSL